VRVRPGPSLTPFRDAYSGFSDSLDDIRHLSANKVTSDPLTDDDLTNHRAFLDEVNARIDREHLTMEKIMKDAQGRWSDEFYELMLDLADEIYTEKKYDARPKDHKALVTGGLGGSGKSTTLEKLKDLKAIDSLGDWITINPDDMKEEMVARGLFPKIEGVSTAEMANIMHGVSAELAHLLGERALSEGHNVIFDVTMGGGSMKQADGTVGSRANEIVGDLQNAGYSDIHGLFMDITVDNSIRNAKARHQRGLEDLRAGRSTEGGRYVPERVIQSNEYKPGPDGQPNPLAYGLTTQNAKGKKVVTPYEDRYGTDPQQKMLATAAEDVRAAIFAATPENAADVDAKLEKLKATQQVVPAGGNRAEEELSILLDEWEFMDPRESGENPATRFKSVNAYNFAKAVRGGAFSEWAQFDNADLDNQQIVNSTDKYKGLVLPARDAAQRRSMSGPLMEGLSGSGDNANASEIMLGLSSGTHELASVPTSDADGKYRLHVPMAHSDEAEFSQYIEYETAEARDKALAQARKLQEESFAKRAEKVSALETPPDAIDQMTNGLVDMPESGTYIENLRGRFRMLKRLEEVKLPGGGWGLRDTASGALVGESGSRQDIAARKEQILNRLYPRLGS
jgi:hypothetical protein